MSETSKSVLRRQAVQRGEPMETNTLNVMANDVDEWRTAYNAQQKENARLQQELDAVKQQKEEIYTIFAIQEKRAEAAESELAALREETERMKYMLGALLMSGDLDSKTVSQVKDMAADFRSELEKERDALHQQVSQLLQPAQEFNQDALDVPQAIEQYKNIIADNDKLRQQVATVQMVLTGQKNYFETTDQTYFVINGKREENKLYTNVCDLLVQLATEAAPAEVK